MAVGEEIGAAVGCLTAFRRPAMRASPVALAGGLAFYPLVGLALGAVAAAAAIASEAFAPAAAGPVGVLVLAALAGVRETRGLRATAALLVRAAAAAVLPPPARTSALLVAPMLGAWAVVVECYGGGPAAAGGVAASLVGRARFREFGWASVTALGVTLGIGEPIGLVVVLAASLATVAMRVYAYRRLGGLTGRLLTATRELVETVVLLTLGILAQLKT